ncbi:PH domain-containing protein [Subtercola boreus]|uniref:YdbS-like PH domain-containing protein n=1 Tax=Subtercola boreus TaxID=120213 RepID=A0A3E0WF16_9MICO|nr:PH domain-containing protein [Subtercola boreus]RFA22618.1 hypothetical protein B7R24_03105 [Subtercola boreus]RFA22974.1 hypothetical protein B7R23_03100 [Subtercola boreus]RFA28725.1 hypothetical protein B7R25_03115 [Subtercola boreus]
MPPSDAHQPGFTSVFRPELPPEQIVARYRAHGRQLFWPTVALVAIAAMSGYFLGRFAEEWQNSAAIVVAAVLVLLFWLVPTLRWLTARCTITTRRVISVRGLLQRERQEASLLRGHDVTLTRRGLQPLFRSGDVTVHSGSEHPLVIRDVPHAGLVVAALAELGDEAYGRA